MDFDEILKKIVEKTGSSEDDIKKKIAEKQRELSNLVSKDGAAYIIAKELGIELFPKKFLSIESCHCYRYLLPLIHTFYVL